MPKLYNRQTERSAETLSAILTVAKYKSLGCILIKSIHCCHIYYSLSSLVGLYSVSAVRQG